MTLLLITQHAPLYLPELVQALVRACRAEIIAATVLPSARPGRWRQFASRILTLYSPADLVRLAGHTLATRRSVRGILKAAGVPLWPTRSVNDPSYIARVRAAAPDVILSLASPQIFGEALLAIPRLGCVNYHSARLPEHRGLLAPFWALAEGATRTGVTVHLMTREVDQGPILAQAEVPILPTDTLHTLCQRSVRIGSGVLREGLAQMRTGAFTERRAPDPNAGSSRGFPTRADVRRFRQSGRRMF